MGAIPPQSVNVGETATLDVASYFRDPDGGALTYTAATSNPGVVSVAVSGSSLALVGVADGTATVTVTATDPGGLTAAQNVAVTVQTPNRAPETVGSIPAQSLDAGQTVRVDVASYFRDPDGDGLGFTAATSAAGVVSVSMSGSRLTLVGVAEGTATVTVTARDPGNLTAEQPVAVTVQTPNRAPVAVGTIPAQTVNTGQTVRLDVASYFRDPDGDPLTYTVETSSAAVVSAGTSGSTLIVAGVAVGTATVTVTAHDPAGLTARQRVAVTVRRPNRAPEAVGSIPAQSIVRGQTATLDVASYFRDPDADALTYSATTSNATVVSAGISGSSVLTLAGVAPGPATVTVTAHDPGGLTAGQTVAVTVTSPDRDALEAFYRATGGPNWTNNTNWLTNAPLDDWHGVTTDSDGRVRGVDLDDNNLSGQIPPELGALSALSLLELRNNNLSGSIPPELGALSALLDLRLAYNDLSGPIPPELGELEHLWYLNLQGNNLSGSIPPDLGQLHGLTTLILGGNPLTGDIPSELGELANLRWLWLGRTELSGPIPPELGQLLELRHLQLPDNNLSGPVPSELGSLTKLERLLLRGNEALSGPLPLSLEGLPLEQFWYNNTDICVPLEASFRAWLASIEDHQGTGVDCRASQVATLQLVSGGGQQGNPGQQLPNPVVVRAADAAGAAVSGATVVFTPGQGHGTASPERAVTNSQGTVQTVWTLGQAVGGQTLTATADGVSLQIAATAAAADDHSCVRGQETHLAWADSVSGELTAGDEDCFVFRAPAGLTGGHLTAWTTSLIDTYGALYDRSYGVIDENDDGPLTSRYNFQVIDTLAVPGTYHVRVTGYNSSTTGPYSIYVDDHGSSPDAATGYFTRHRPDSVTVAGDLSVPYNVDYFFVGNFDEPTTVSFATTGSTDTFGALYDEQGNQVVSNDDDGPLNNFRFLHQLQANIDYYVRVTGFGRSTGPYLLHLWLPQPSAGATNLTNDSAVDDSPAWSPDGTKIAFASDRDGNQKIYVMNADGSGAVSLTGNATWDSDPAWSPDGTRIAFLSYSPTDGAEIYVMNADGSGQTRLTNNSAIDGDPAWSPDGTKIAFHSARDGDSEIYVMNPDGTGVINLTNNSAPDAAPAWSPDGTRIAFQSFRDGDLEIYVMNADGTGQARITNNSADDVDPAWSPDGTRIAFASRRDGNLELYVMNADGTGQARITNNSADDFRPAWSPDGTRIAFLSARGGNWDIYVMDVPATDGAASLQLGVPPSASQRAARMTKPPRR